MLITAWFLNNTSSLRYTLVLSNLRRHVFLPEYQLALTGNSQPQCTFAFSKLTVIQRIYVQSLSDGGLSSACDSFNSQLVCCVGHQVFHNEPLLFWIFDCVFAPDQPI